MNRIQFQISQFQIDFLERIHVSTEVPITSHVALSWRAHLAEVETDLLGLTTKMLILNKRGLLTLGFLPWTCSTSLHHFYLFKKWFKSA